MCLLIRCIGPGTVSVVLHRHRSTLLQSAITAKPDSEFIHQARFVTEWNFGEAQLGGVKRDDGEASGVDGGEG